MPQVRLQDRPDLAEKMAKAVKDVQKPQSGSSEPPVADTPPSLTYPLCGGYLADDGQWVTEFTVRELTGRDEEALARLKEPSKVLTTILERGLVAVGDEKATPEVVDGLLAGDWETVLLAIRIATFGNTATRRLLCRQCNAEYEVEIDLTENIERRTAGKDDLTFTVKGRHGTEYTVTHAYGQLQRKIMASVDDITVTSANTTMLSECVVAVNSRPLLGSQEALDLPMADRREILREIESRRVGPQMQEVTTSCPDCGSEQSASLTVAALF